MALLQIKNLTFSYPETKNPVLQGINLDVKQGEFIVLFGESGSGKTTLLKLLKRELAPHGEKSGMITYDGTPIDDLTDRVSASELGYVMQNPESQIVTDKVWHELSFGLENLGIKTSVIRRRVGEIANFFGIHTLFRNNTTDLSGGQKQLLNLASIMVMQPKVLILDEPTSQLDPIAATNFINTLKMLNEELGLTIILVEHRLEEVLPLADRVILLEDNKLLLESEPKLIGHELMQKNDNHQMFLALPTSIQVYHALGFSDMSPLTIREGRMFLENNYQPVTTDLIEEADLNKEVVIELKEAWFRYERDLPDVLANIDMKIYQGEILSILGGNGSGKTTLLNVMSGVSKAYRGIVKINGKPIKNYKGAELYRHNLAVLPQDPQTIFIKSTLRDDYTEIMKILDYSKAEMETAINEVSEMLAITHLLESHPYDLSGGEQQKAALGKILLLKPKILLLDEPTKGIDAFSKEVLAEIIRELQAEDLTIILVTHDIEFAAAVSDRVGLFFDKEMISLDTPTRFFSENNFYTTAASRMSRHLFDHTITKEKIINMCESQNE